MNLVLDASAAYLLLTVPQTESALDAADDVLAPDLIVPELLNARWKMGRAGHTTPAIEFILSFTSRLRLFPSSEFAAEADALARLIDHSVYDCLYAAVATRSGATLLTADARFARKVPELNVSVIAAAS